MSALSASTSSLHRDNRSDRRSYKRDKEHSAKWAHGARVMPGINARLQSVEYGEKSYDDADLPKMRPEKQWSDRWHGNKKSHANVITNSTNMRDEFGRAAGRVSRKQYARMEISWGNSPNASFCESVPFGHYPHTPTHDAGVMYSYDVKSSPQKAVGLENLVEKAEEAFNSRETARIVRDEYEILDTKGETVKVGKKTSPKQVAQIVVDDEDDWEQI